MKSEVTKTTTVKYIPLERESKPVRVREHTRDEKAPAPKKGLLDSLRPKRKRADPAKEFIASADDKM